MVTTAIVSTYRTPSLWHRDLRRRPRGLDRRPPGGRAPSRDPVRRSIRGGPPPDPARRARRLHRGRRRAEPRRRSTSSRSSTSTGSGAGATAPPCWTSCGACALPVVTTLHTVLRDPTPSQRAILTELVALSATTVVMSRAAAELLTRVLRRRRTARSGSCPHGVPSLPLVEPDSVKPALGLEGRQVILSFGLLGPGKGYEAVIAALPEVVKASPTALYVVLGATHPDLLAHEGEAYRERLDGGGRSRWTSGTTCASSTASSAVGRSAAGSWRPTCSSPPTRTSTRSSPGRCRTRWARARRSSRRRTRMPANGSPAVAAGSPRSRSRTRSSKPSWSWSATPSCGGPWAGGRTTTATGMTLGRRRAPVRHDPRRRGSACPRAPVAVPPDAGGRRWLTDRSTRCPEPTSRP